MASGPPTSAFAEASARQAATSPYIVNASVPNFLIFVQKVFEAPSVHPKAPRGSLLEDPELLATSSQPRWTTIPVKARLDPEVVGAGFAQDLTEDLVALMPRTHERSFLETY